jgi:ElaB/YqjD/DUF883 family membrane-anchored ribosome-binding protein
MDRMDPREQTAAEAALIQHLVETVVIPEVMEPMEAIGWSHAAPPPPRPRPDNPEAPGNTSAPAPVAAPVVSGQPAPTPAPVAPVAGEPKKDTPAEAAPASGDPLAFLEGMKDPKTGLYGGKYRTREEFIRGVGHVVQMAKGAYSQADVSRQEVERLRAENAQLRTQPVASPAAAPQPAPVAPASQAAAPVRSAKLDAVLSKLKDEGGILDEESLNALVEGLSEVATARAEQSVENRINARENARQAEDARWRKVDEHMQEVAPESLVYSNEVGLYVQSTPLVAAAVGAMIQQGKLNEAAELSWTMFKSAHEGMTLEQINAATTAKQVQLEAGDQVRREAVEQARKDAGVITSSATGVHETPGAVGPTQEEIDRAAAEMQAGDGTRWRALTIGRTLTDPIFDR